LSGPKVPLRPAPVVRTAAVSGPGPSSRRPGRRRHPAQPPAGRHAGEAGARPAAGPVRRRPAPAPHGPTRRTTGCGRSWRTGRLVDLHNRHDAVPDLEVGGQRVQGPVQPPVGGDPEPGLEDVAAQLLHRAVEVLDGGLDAPGRLGLPDDRGGGLQVQPDREQGLDDRVVRTRRSRSNSSTAPSRRLGPDSVALSVRSCPAQVERPDPVGATGPAGYPCRGAG
jgi:hypothetical protein